MPDTIITVAGENDLDVLVKTSAEITVEVKHGPISITGGTSDVDFEDIGGLPEDNPALLAEFETKVDKVSGKGLSTEDYTTTEKNKLSGIASGATANSTDADLRNRSTHTGVQDASTITEDSTHRFTTDAEKTTWDAKQPAGDYATNAALNAGLTGKADLVGGLVPTAQIPAIAISEFLGSVASQAAMLALSGQKGDWAIRTDLGVTYIITGNDPTQLSDWTAVSTPADAVSSVNGQAGVVVLGKNDVGLGNVPNEDATNPANIDQTASYRFVTDTEKSTWNAKQDALGFAPAPLASPTFTGTPSAPTAAPGTNTTQLATTEFVLANSGAIQEYSTTNPSTPSSGITLFSRLRAGRRLLSQITQLGLMTEFQESLFGNKVSFWIAQGNGTTANAVGLNISTTGTAQTRTVATTNFLTQQRRVGYAAAASGNQSAGIRNGGAQFWRGNGANLGGFFLVVRFNLATLGATTRGLVGFHNSANVFSGEPSAGVSCVFFAFDSAGTTWKLMHNDASGTCTIIDLGANYPVNTTDVYEARFFCAPNASSVFVSMNKLNSSFIYEAEITTDLPASTQLLSPQVWINNGAGTEAVAVDIVHMYISTLY